MRILLLTMMMILASTASAGAYKWVDSEGNVHYSQYPPKDKPFKTLKAPLPAPQNTQSPDPETKEKKSNAEDTIKAETAKNAKIRQENCEIGKNNLNSYQLYRRIRAKDGTVTVVDDKERAHQIESAKQLIRDFCN